MIFPANGGRCGRLLVSYGEPPALTADVASPSIRVQREIKCAVESTGRFTPAARLIGSRALRFAQSLNLEQNGANVPVRS
jgi:pyruvate-formate lyase-activating enzyme